MKVKVLVLDVGGCEGCPIAILRALPQLINVAEVHSSHLGNADLDDKYDIAFITGSVCINDERAIRELRKVRENSEILIAFGSCASFGGITRFCRGGQDPRPEHRVYQPISSVVEVDYAIPGCPPAPQVVQTIITNLIKGPTPLLKIFAAAAKVKKLSGFDLLDDVVLSGLCIGCGACVLSCPTHALQMVEKKPDLVVEKCIRCGTCYVRCPRATHILLTRYSVQIKVLAPRT